MKITSWLKSRMPQGKDRRYLGKFETSLRTENCLILCFKRYGEHNEYIRIELTEHDADELAGHINLWINERK